MHSLALVPAGTAFTPPKSIRWQRAERKLAQASQPISIVAPRPLPLPPPKSSTATALARLDVPVDEPVRLVIESSHVLLSSIPPSIRKDITGCVQRTWDAIIQYVAGSGSAHQFSRNMAGIQSSVIGLHRKLHPTPPEPRHRHNPFNAPGTGDRFHYGKNPFAATKLGELLLTCLGIRVKPDSGYWVDGDLMYRLQHSSIFGYFLIIERRAPDGEGLLTTMQRRITTQEEAQAALYQIDLEYQWRAGALGCNPDTWITLRVDLDDVSKVNKALEREQERQRLNAQAAQAGAAAAGKSYRRQKAASPPDAPTLFALPAPKMEVTS